MRSDEDWAKEIFQQANGEIPQAFNQLHSNINWALVLVSLILTGVIIKGAFDLTTFGITFFTLIMLVGFFVRSSLGYVNLSRWNKIASTASAYLIADESSKSDILAELKLTYETYALPNWFSPLSRSTALLQNAKFFRFWFVIAAIVSALSYQLYYMNIELGGISSADEAGVLVISAVGSVAILYEVSALFDGSYFKHVDADRKTIDLCKSLRKRPDPKLRRSLPYLGMAFILLVVAFGATGAQSGSRTYVPQTMSTVGGYYTVQLPVTIGAAVTLYWQSNSPVLAGVMPANHLIDLNSSSVGAATSLGFGANGTIQYLITTSSYFFMLQSQVALVHISYVYNSAPSSPAFWLSYLVGFVVLIASIIWKALMPRNRDVLKASK